eukprot:gene7011-7225_t
MDALVDGLALLWPGSSADDIVRRQLALLLLEDPDNRLRVAHLEPLLHLRVSPRAACSTGRLQALLTDPVNTRIFPVDFQDSKVADWRSRVVYLDQQQLSQEVAAAKQQQHQGYSAAALCAGRTSREPSGNLTSSISNFSADIDAPAREVLSPSSICLSQQQELQQGGHMSIVAQKHANSVGQQPLMLDSIFSASPIMAHGNHSHAVDKTSSGGAKTAADAHAGATAGLSDSYGVAVGSAGAADLLPPSISLFGSSFEVPHAIASCWAPSSSFDSGTSSDLARATRGRAAVAGKRNAESLDVHEAGGGSSTASGSSSRSVSATTRVVGASTASRLRQASNNHAADAADLADAAAGEQLSAVCSSGALSGLDVATPMSCRNGGVSGSPANSSSCEDDVEYNEAQLVFGLPGCAAGPAASNVSGTAVDSGGNGGIEAVVASASAVTPRERDGPSVKDALLEATTPLHGVDCNCISAAGLQDLLLSAGSFERDNSNLAMYGAGAVGLGVNGMGLGARQPLEVVATVEKPAGVPTLGQTPRLTGWASIAAKEPKASPATPKAVAAGREGLSSGNIKQPTAVGAQAGNGTIGGGKAADASKGLHKLPARVRSEVHSLVAQYAGVLKAEDFDDGVVHQLNAKRSEDEAVAAVRHIAHYDLANIQHMAAYLNHLVKHYNHNAAAAAAAASDNGSLTGAGPGAVGGPTAATPSSGAAARPGAAGAAQGGSLGGTSASRTSGSTAPAVAGAGGNLGAFGGQIRLASVPVSTKAMLQKLPLKVFRQLEQLVAGCAYLEWRHFDAGVVKVLAQLSKLCEADVFEELELLAATDLSNVEYMPAYLNKRLNNKLWSRRKAIGDVPNA